ncbi:protease modulator HflK [uncultured Nevskia sp.]|uniref:protease modulator HflK n=1 Tax=uncultured Nevskia sp. TaxID=228950 RepID=UPI0025EF2193|nr:protease modulator HflK [uncultured Nevskia sp.]
MPVDLNSDGLDLAAQPRFRLAALQARRLLIQALALGAPALVALAAAWVWPAAADSLLAPLAAAVGAALWVLALGLLSARSVAVWRRAAIAPLTAAAEPLPPDATRYRRALWKLRCAARALIRLLRSDGARALFLALAALLPLITVIRCWNLALPGAALGQLGYAGGAALLLMIFGLLVLERWFANLAAAESPEAARLARLVRVPLLILSLAAACLFFSRADSLWPARLAVLAGLLPAAVAAEFALRALLSLFIRRPPTEEPRLLADSYFARQLQWPPRPLANLQDELQQRFGIDLRQNWAFGYMRRALLPVLGAVLLVGWLMTGIREIAIDGRGIYERFGKPVEVLGPGLHAGLPWPFGRLRAVENGSIHAISTVIEDDEAPDTSSAEGLPPDSSNRLWDAAHESENGQVIAGLAGDRQSFQVINMDVRFIYRIGLGDAAAMAATYNSADLPTLIRNTAGRVLVEDFASRTLDGVLSEKRDALARDVGRRVQADLDALGSGVEILATLIEQIHPPSGAANAYHGVQASLIKAQAAIARERGRAAEEINDAQLQASIATDKANAIAREAMSGAEAVQLRFAAEQSAYQAAGKAFVLEQYLGQLSSGLKDAKLVLLDHRIGSGASAPTLDLRRYAPPADTAMP